MICELFADLIAKAIVLGTGMGETPRPISLLCIPLQLATQNNNHYLRLNYDRNDRKVEGNVARD